MTKVVTLSGWGQNFNALENIAPGANHIAYRDFGNTEKFLSSLKDIACDVLIGWSLGGQLALNAIDAGVLSPKLLVLIATPFQTLKSNSFRCGMDIDTFNEFESDFIKKPEETLNQFILMIAQNDSKAKEIITALRKNKETDAVKWLPWLDELRNFSCNKLDFQGMPKTLSIHGRDDTVFDVSQAGIFHPFIKDYTSIIFEKCGHAPHLHDTEKVRNLIQEAAA
ncbi:MAG: hydrolase [Rickettsiaceae bacterium]|jgi:pimeloyl-ACP methyl ester carboxylesterase|nr:hydrolase [Rickettsiaceae bacterium]